MGRRRLHVGLGRHGLARLRLGRLRLGGLGVGLGGLGPDPLADFAARQGVDVASMARWLAPNLADS